MVACLERTDGNIEFHQIVDFLTSSPIHYPLTQIHATVDGKTVVITESSVRNDLYFNDEDGITCLSNEEIFENLALMRQAKRGQDTEIPQSSGPPKKVGDEAVYTGEDERVVRAATTATSLEVEPESGNIDKTRSTATLNEPTPQEISSEGHTPGRDEGRPNINELMAICTQLSNRVLTLEQFKTAQDFVIKKLQNKIKRLEKNQRARTLGMNLFKIGTSRRKSLDKENVSKQGMNLKTRIKEGDFDYEFDDINYMVDKAMEYIEEDTVNAGGAVNTATIRVSAASALVTIAGVSISTVELRTPPTTTTKAFEDKDLTISQTLAFEDKDLTIAQTLVKMRGEKAKEKGVVFINAEESARQTTILQTIDPKDKGKGIMQEPEKP
nr:hypothetical protein [Tanacetum cinerariifolium]